jgi:hypothetical protein
VFRKKFNDLFSPTFLVSCKNNHLPVVLFSHRNDLEGVSGMTPFAKAGYPLEVQRQNELDSVEELLKFEQFHHYYRAPNVASQYCRLIEKRHGNLKHIAEHGDLYADLESLVKAVDAERQSYIADEKYLFKIQADAEEEDINFVPIYPVVILRHEFYECVQTRRGVRIREANHAVLLHRTESRLLKSQVCIDFIRESYLNRYLNMIETECDEMQKRLLKHRKVLRQNALREMRQLQERRADEALADLIEQNRRSV